MTKKKLNVKKSGVYIDSEKTLEFEESELTKVHIERVINKIKKDFIDLFPKL